MARLDQSLSDYLGLTLSTLSRALSQKPFLLVSTYPFAGAGFNKVNGLASPPRSAREPLLVTCDNARATTPERSINMSVKARRYGSFKAFPADPSASVGARRRRPVDRCDDELEATQRRLTLPR
jgi:hypothetical protein